MSEVKHIDSIGKLLQDLLERHRNNELDGIVIGVLEKKDGYCESYWAGLSYLKRLGLAENLKTAIIHTHRNI